MATENALKRRAFAAHLDPWGSRQNEDSPLMTLGEAALFLRCSKAHLCNIVNGKVASLPPMPVVRIGRRSLLRRDALIEWLKAVER